MKETRVVYDSGALIAAEKRSETFKSAQAEVRRRGALPLIPGPVLTQAWSGDRRSFHMARVVETSDIVLEYPLEVYKRAGVLLREVALPSKKRPDAVDALVAMTAAIFEAEMIVTSDPEDITAYAKALNYQVVVLPV